MVGFNIYSKSLICLWTQSLALWTIPCLRWWGISIKWSSAQGRTWHPYLGLFNYRNIQGWVYAVHDPGYQGNGKHVTCTIVPQKSGTGAHVLPSTWAFKVKWFPDGRLRKLKAIFCARGDRQVEGLYFFEKYAPVLFDYIQTHFDLDHQPSLV